jgi:hypothetical protein
MNDELIKRIAEHLRGDKNASACPPASLKVVKDEESSIGFAFPPVLELLYSTIGNGGFGPGYGIIGVRGGHASNLGTLAETFSEMKAGAKYLGLKWPDGVVPFCEWGCNIFSCIDCADPNYPLVESDECRTRATGYNLERFFNMWLEGTDILGVNGPPRQTAEIIDPFTGKKTRVTGRR